MEKQFNNIPAHGFSIVNQSTDRMILRIEAFKEGNIMLSPFSVVQILEGAEHMPELQSDETRNIARSVFNIYVKLNSAFRKIQLNNVPEQMEFAITRRELLTLIQWLKLRMAHCEAERDQRTMIKDGDGNDIAPKFNADTYIGQKMLLLELLSLAMGTIVD